MEKNSILVATSIKYLGIFLDENLSWKKHVNITSLKEWSHQFES